MRINSTKVALAACTSYDRATIRKHAEQMLSSLGITVSRGSRVLLKPNLVAARNHDGLACTHPEVVAALAEWCLERGAIVSVGDSPAFGTARGVMRTHGIASSLAGLPVSLVNFNQSRPIVLASGIEVGIARQIFECDILVNLPKIKAHNQLYVSLAVKNFFGAVVGFRKALLHARYGEVGTRFEELIVDLLTVLPGGFSFADGIVAMQRRGPLKGEPCPLGVLSAAENPVALETALLEVLGLQGENSPVWRECQRRGMIGCKSDELHFPLLTPDTVRAAGFLPPETLKPVSFHPLRLLVSGVKRAVSRIASEQ